MLNIKLSTAYGGKPFMRQAPQGKAVWGNCVFHINEDLKECDFWVVYGGLEKKQEVLCQKENTIFITNEPPSVKKHKKEFLDQFGTIVTCDRDIKHPHIIFSQQALPWRVGHNIQPAKNTLANKNYDELKTIHTIKKEKLLSVVVSNKKFTGGHRARLDFIKKLKKHFGDKIDVFGEGFNPIDDKWDAIAPYKYHIAIENSSYNDYWTEKIADGFLAGSYVIYYGCPNITDYFPAGAMSIIDINKPEDAIKTIEGVLASGSYERALSDIALSKELVLEKYQIFPMIASLCEKMASTERGASKSLVTLVPESKEKTFLGFIKEIPNRIKTKFYHE